MSALLLVSAPHPTVPPEALPEAVQALSAPAPEWFAKAGPERFYVFGSGIAEDYHMRWFEAQLPNRGVAIRLIVETPNRIEGQGEYDCLLSLGNNVASACSVYCWPQW